MGGSRSFEIGIGRQKSYHKAGHVNREETDPGNTTRGSKKDNRSKHGRVEGGGGSGNGGRSLQKNNLSREEGIKEGKVRGGIWQ